MNCGKAFSLVYNVDDHAHEDLIEQVALRYIHDNALNPFKYPSLLRMEQEIISMACSLLGAPPRAGAVTSGGTESIFCAVQVARCVHSGHSHIARCQWVSSSVRHNHCSSCATRRR